MSLCAEALLPLLLSVPLGSRGALLWTYAEALHAVEVRGIELLSDVVGGALACLLLRGLT